MQELNCSSEKSISIKGNYWAYQRPSIEFIEKLKLSFNLSSYIASILANRNIDERNLSYFLNPTLKNNLPDPSILENMDNSIKILIEKIFNYDTLGILGDYDVDGATSTAILFKYFEFIGIKATVYIPDRIKDGYGISKNSIDFFIRKKVDLLISLDCGTNDSKSISYAKEKGIEIIVIDHHEVKNLGLPLSIINPKLKSDTSNLNNLCTAGLVFLFVVGLNRELRKKNFFKNKEEINLKEFLDIVAVGTICDLVPLQNENRLLVKKGLEKINLKPNKGLSVLKSKLELENKTKTSDIAYYIGPCINAAGRIGDPFLGFKLLVKNETKELEIIADKLINSNNERKTLEDISYTQAKMLLKNSNNMKFIFLYSKTWHPGIIGILASRLVQEFKVPAFVMNIDNNKVIGSVRSIKNVDISKILTKLVNEEFLEVGGGHAMAGGFRLKEEKLSSLQSYLKENSKIFFKSNKSILNIDLEVKIFDLNVEMINSLEQLEPYGMDYPEPKILIKKVSSVYFKIIGKNRSHLSCMIEDINGQRIKAVIFNYENNILRVIKEKLEFDAIGRVSLNVWENKKKPQFFIEDLRVI